MKPQNEALDRMFLLAVLVNHAVGIFYNSDIFILSLAFFVGLPGVVLLLTTIIYFIRVKNSAVAELAFFSAIYNLLITAIVWWLMKSRPQIQVHSVTLYPIINFILFITLFLIKVYQNIKPKYYEN